MLTFIDLCAGIGGFRYGLEKAGLQCIGYAENDKFARRSYEAMYDTEGEWTAWDINSLKSEDIPDANVWTFGFPCQDISIARLCNGGCKGLEGKRSGLFYKIADLLYGKENKPDFIIVENVKHLLKINRGWDFARVLIGLDKCGYDTQWQVVDSRYFGLKQSRERVYIVGILRGSRYSGSQVLPVKRTSRSDIKQRLLPTTEIEWAKNVGIYHTNKPHLKFRSSEEPVWTIAAYKPHGVYYKDRSEIRKFTPRECFRLQGFPDELFDKARKVNSDSQLYTQIGNAVSTPIPYEIGKKLVELENAINTI